MEEKRGSDQPLEAWFFSGDEKLWAKNCYACVLGDHFLKWVVEFLVGLRSW